MTTEAEELGAVLAFCERFVRDREDGTALSLAAYQKDYPGCEDAVARAYGRFMEDTPRTRVAEEFPTTSPNAAPYEFAAATRIGPYVVERELGRGGQGVVLLARDERLGRRVALKVLSGPWSASPDALRRFAAEARTLGGLDHPGLCAVYEAAEADGFRYIAMRYVDGETLHALLARRAAARAGAPPDDREIVAGVALVEKLARAVHAAHEAGVVHRDLKPGNVMVAAEESPVVLDFGLARVAESDESHTLTGDLVGTPAYMAPEQAAGDVRAVDRRTDVHALGAILYEIVVGRRAFDGAHRAALLDAVRLAPPPDPRRANPGVGADLRVVLETALAKAPGDRYPSALALADDLRRVRLYEPVAARPISSIGRLRRWSRRRPAVAALAAALLVVVPAACVFGGLWLADRDRVAAQRAHEREARYEALVETGFGQLSAGDDEARRTSLAAFARARGILPDGREALYGLLLVQLARRDAVSDPAAALALIEEERPRRPGDGVLERLRGDALLRLGRGDEGRAALAATPPPRDDVAYFVDAVRASRESELSVPGADERVVALLETAIQLAPTRRRVYFVWLARAVGRLRDVEKARRTADVVKLIWPDRFGRHLAGYALAAADSAGALAEFEAAADTDPRGQVNVLQGMAHSFVSEGRLDEAARTFRRLTEAKPDDATQFLNLALTLTRLKRYAEALPAAARAVALRPDLADAQAQLGILLRLTGGDRDQAVAALRKAAELDPEHAAARIELAWALAAGGAVAEATEILDACEDLAEKSGLLRQWESVYHFVETRRVR
jgi:serine/threonine protein kinase